MFSLKDICDKLKPKRALVLGDFMLDVYTMGHVERISPEAPVPVLHVMDEHFVPGGTGNAILNLISLGMEVRAMGRVGQDPSGETFLQSLRQEGVDLDGVLIDPTFVTPRKNRMMAESQQVVRVDYEKPALLSEEQEKKLIADLPKFLEGIDVVAISDYAKGFLTPSLLTAVIERSTVPVIVDPKGMDFSRYSGATVIKPNFSEAKGAAGLGPEATLDEIGAAILSEVDIQTLLITRSQEGISIFSKGEKKRQDFEAVVHEVRDVTGAGDTVLALLTAALANGCSLEMAAPLSNIAASIAIERVGCARVTIEDLTLRLAH
ncbi:MAG: Bifunctional protein HldE [Chlamydiales bacterium]|nr:Bifunctional protein HldE [Chlamydiales bacterium]MCH9622477.1 Bifunctional protein HldE [Chlamydiales bacterium]